MRRGMWALALGTVGQVAFYAMYVWIAFATIDKLITIGAMTMYVLVFKQGQSALSSALGDIGGMYEDNLYLSNLYEFLDTPTQIAGGTAAEGTKPGDGVRFEGVSFTYPEAKEPALDERRLAHPAGQQARDRRRERLRQDHADQAAHAPVRADRGAHHARRPRPARVVDRARCTAASASSSRTSCAISSPSATTSAPATTARTTIASGGTRPPTTASPSRSSSSCPDQYDAQLGRWFKQGRELSGGQWQKVALARSFMRKDADILVLDEPTAAMDAEAEVQIFDRFRAVTTDKIAIVISHRFSTVRMADEIIVLDHGRIIERGSHDQLVAHGGRYATLFNLQAQGYR